MCYCPGVEGLLLSCHDQSLNVCFYVAFIEPLTCAAMSATSDTSVPGAMQRLLIPSCSFIWLFPGGYKALAFSHQ